MSAPAPTHPPRRATRRVATGTAVAIIAGGTLLGWLELRFGVPPVPASHLPVVVYATPMLDPIVVRAAERADPVKVVAREAARASAKAAKASVTAAVAAEAPQKKKVFERLAGKVPVQFTQYCLQGRTRRDNWVREGIVAADPRVFPLGRYVDLFVGGKRLGRYLVDDTGGVVKGNIIDIWTPSCKDAIRFGRRRGYAVLLPKDSTAKPHATER